MGNRYKRACFCAALGLLLTGSSAGAQPVDDGLLYLRAVTVDPQDRPSLLDGRVLKFETGKDYVIKLDGPMTPQRRSALIDAGVDIGDYIPRHAWRVDLSKANRTAVRQLNFVTWLGEFDSSWKLCPKIAENKPFKTKSRHALQRAGEKRLVLHLARDANLDAVENAIASCGAKVCDAPESRRAPMLTIDIPATRVSELCDVPDVRFIEEAPEGTPRNQSAAWIAQSNIPDVTSIWDQGLHGENQIVGLIDWDLDENHCAFFDDAPFGNLHRKIQAYYGLGENALFGWHGTHVACALTGDPLGEFPDANLFGMAFASRLVFQDFNATITTVNLLDRLTIAHDDGARIHSNSWGATVDNSYNAWARDIDSFSHDNEDDLVIFAVINGGAATPILSPENAKNCLAVGASGDGESRDAPGSGGTGPTIDGRQKPEVWMPGCDSNSANFGTACDVVTRDCATSWAAPATSGMAAMARQYFTDGFYPSGSANPSDAFTPSGSLVKAILINSAVDMLGIEGYFGAREGWGRILLDAPLYFDGETRRLLIDDVRHDAGLETNDEHDFVFDVLSENEPLKITMVFADAPSTVGTSFAPVNDLNLIVTSPSGMTYVGNDFEGTESTTGGTGDMLNNSEQVHRLSPEVGQWRATIVAAEVNVGTQGFALVVTGDIMAAGGAAADLDVAITPAGPLSANPGDEIDATISVLNLGPDAAENVGLRYALPDGLSFVSGGALPMECAMSADELSCMIGDLQPDAEYAVDVRLRVDQIGSFTTNAVVTGDVSDPMPDNNTAGLVIETSQASADLQLIAISTPTSLRQNASVAIELGIRNNGPNDDPGATLSALPDAGLVIDSIATCVAMPNETTCELPEISSGDTMMVTATIRATSDAVGKLSVQFRSDGTLDQFPDNNILTFSIDIIADADNDGVSDPDDICPDGDDTIDTDEDGVPDACDECPSDPNKSKIGICDCGNPETDSDGDGLEDCADLCPLDPDKIIPGDCGCGASEEDTNQNGVPDCLDTPIDMSGPDDEEEPIDIPEEDVGFRLEDLDPCLVRYLLQSFLGIPMCGPCISFGMIGSFSGIAILRRRVRRKRIRVRSRDS